MITVKQWMEQADVKRLLPLATPPGSMEKLIRDIQLDVLAEAMSLAKQHQYEDRARSKDTNAAWSRACEVIAITLDRKMTLIRRDETT